MSSRPGPVDLSSMLQKQQQSAAFKPKFLSKADREKQALEKREAEAAEVRKRDDDERRRKEEFERKARQAATAPSSSRSYARDGDRRDDRGRHNGTNGREYDRWHARDELDYGSANGQPAADTRAATKSSSTSTGPSADSRMTEAERTLLRNKYLGIQEPPKKKSRTERKKLAFDWDAEEDTSDKYQSVPIKPAESGPADKGTAAGDLMRRGAKSALAEKHWSEKSLDEMRERDWRIFREDFGIASKGGTIPKPLRSWKESDIPTDILHTIDEIGYKEPSPIQRQAIPIGLQNRDLIGVAETGSGKTASFVIPMLAYISKLPRLSEVNRHLGPYALIISPTRELAQQIEVETKKFTDQLGFTCVSIVGGRDMDDQSHSLRNGAEIIVATPGRLKDCIERHVLVLSQCHYLVLDEADKSIGMGFAEALDFILDSMPASNLKPDTEESENPLALEQVEGAPRYRVTMLYSATMPPSVERLAKNYLRRPATITIGEANQAVSTVEQHVEFIGGEDKKRARLLQILSSGFEPPVIVFSTTIQSVDQLAHDLRREGFNATTLHSKKTQTQREESLASLRSGQSDILVATDLAGRGIDVPNVSAVINYSFPTTFEAYIHRIGRTGRAGKKGVAYTFMDNTEDEFRITPSWFRQKFYTPRARAQMEARTGGGGGGAVLR